MFEGKEQCPRCKRVWVIPQGMPGRYCICHLICPDGNEPYDCNMTAQNYSGPLGWPVGMDQGQIDEGEDVRHRTYYCSTHNKYSYREPIWLEVDWNKWYQQKKLPEKFREMKKR